MMPTWDDLVADADAHMRSGKHPREWSPPGVVVGLAEEYGLTAESLRDHILAAAFERRMAEIRRRQQPGEATPHQGGTR